jgi:hypothetical protein
MLKRKKIVIYTGIIVVLIFAILFSGRYLAFNYVLKKSLSKIEKKFNVTAKIGHYQMKGLAGASFQNMVIYKSNVDTLFKADSMEVSLKFLPLLIGHVNVKEFLLVNSRICLAKSFLDSLNFKDTTAIQNKNTDFASRLKKPLEQFFAFIPGKLFLRNCNIEFSDSSNILTFNLKEIAIHKTKLSGKISISDKYAQTNFDINGKVEHKSQKIHVHISNPNQQQTIIPYLKEKWNLELSIHDASMDMQVMNTSSKRLAIAFGGSINQVQLNQPKISTFSINFDSLSASFVLKAEKNSFEIDSMSQIGFNGFYFPLYLHYQKDTNRIMILQIPTRTFAAQSFFDALPEGIFQGIAGIKTTGNLSFGLLCKINFDQLDSVEFSSFLQPDQFRIQKYGRANLSILNDTFSIYRHDPGMQPVIIHVDSMDKNYTRLRDVSSYLKYAILTSEDGSFYYHKGFNEEAFSKSIAENIRKKRFARGGSTITMQLVKNVFLSRNKTISRKFEELLLTWMVENLHIATKDKMFEVYLNIIEWGPNIYGIQRASEFYFNKKPSQLNLSESIYLASIIPSPKYYRYTFVKNGELKESFDNYFKRVSQIMLARNQISVSDTVGLTTKIMLTGKAKDFLQQPVDSAIWRNDSILLVPDDEKEDLPF